ncbi:hypothetical protein Tco_0140080 [Tanacetum coccineum]
MLLTRCGVKDKPQVGSLSPRKWRTRDMIVAAKHGDKVLNVQPVSEFNPTTGIQVLKPLVKDKPLVVEKPEKVKDKALVKKPADVVEKPKKVKDKATVKKPADVVEKPVTVVVKDKATVKNSAVVATVKKPANVVEKPAVLVKEKDKDKAQVSIVKENDVVPDVGLEKVVSNDKDLSDFVSNKRRRRTELPKLNAPADVADKESDVVNNKDKESDVADKELDVDKDKFGANELLSDVVSKKRRRRTELPKVNVPAVMADKPLVEKSVVKPAVKPAVKAALKPAVKGNESKKLKSKSGMKRKIKNSSDSLSSFVDEKELRRLLKKLKYVKQEDSDESVSDRKMKYKKNEKELTPSEVAHEEYLKHFPTLRARAVPKSLFAAIQGSQVDMWSFLSEIGFNSFHNLAIDEIPSRVGRFCVANFNSYTYKLFLDSSDSIHVTPSKIHDILDVAGVKEKNLFGCGPMLAVKIADFISKIDCYQSLEFNFDETKRKAGTKRTCVHDESTGGGSMLTTEKEEVHVEDDGNRVVDGNGDVQDDNGGSKKQVESTEKQSVDPTDPTGKENVFEEENDITCTPESYTQWLDANAILFFRGNAGDALDAINLDIVRMEESDAVPVTPERLATRVSKLSPSPEKRRVKPSSYLLSPYMNKTTKTFSMFDGTYATDEERWENFSAQVSAQFKDNVNGLSLNGIDLKKLFTRHLKLYGHQRHSKIQRLKAKILKMKWKTKTNFRDCSIFTMLHMESYSGQTASTWEQF